MKIRDQRQHRSLKNGTAKAGETAAPAEDPGVTPNTHMTAHKHLLTPGPRDPIPSPGLWALHACSYKDIHGTKTHRHIK